MDKLAPISTHTLTWSVTVASKYILLLSDISTHTLTWSVTLYLPLLYTISTPFQLTRSRGAWHDGQERKEHQKNFNSHAHVERDQTPHQCRRYIRHFNSHAHVERDDGEDRQSNKIKISTHTLTWSVTFRCLGFWGGLFISTHTLTWSVTCVVQISVAVQKFQLTRSRGAWLKSSCLAHAVIHFNSHAHVERDFYKSSPILTSFCISTHTLTWSVTKFITCSSMVSGISTHTLTWSVTGNNIQCIEKRQFQLTRSRGAWPVQLAFAKDKEFQLTRSRGAWPCWGICTKGTAYFNSHAHVERDRYRVGICKG